MACPSTTKPPPAAAEPAYPPLSWTAPSCVAYAAFNRGYACLDFSFQTSATGPEDIEPFDFTTWKPVPGTSWGGHKALQLMANESTLVPIAEKSYDSDSSVKDAQTEVAAQRQAVEQGFDATLETAAPLENGVWTDVAGASLRFRSRLQVDGATEYYVGSLEFVCPGALASSAKELLPKQRGQIASVFAAKDATAIVVSVLESGGEGGGWAFRTNNIRIDIAAICGS